jgi:hypothetical protein
MAQATKADKCQCARQEHLVIDCGVFRGQCLDKQERCSAHGNGIGHDGLANVEPEIVRARVMLFNRCRLFARARRRVDIRQRGKSNHQPCTHEKQV